MPSPIDAALTAFARGEMLIVTDDASRENEGDLVVAAQSCTPQHMAFLIRHSSGIICAPMPADHARRLQLDPMVARNDAPLATAFTVSVDARKGLTTGISAIERCNCVRALADPASIPADFVRPGHVFPLIAREGGVLMRSGHTEAAVDLCQLAGLSPVGVIGELMNDDGTVMRGQQILDFAAKHNLPLLSVADLIHHRQARERLVERLAQFKVTSPVGELQAYTYGTPFDAVQHMAFVYGEVAGKRPVLVRLHRADVVADVINPTSKITQTLEVLAHEGAGILIYLRDGAAGVPVKTHQEGEDEEASRQKAWREIGLGAQILKDLGVEEIILLTATPSLQRRFIGLEGFGMTIAGTRAVG